MSDVIDNAVGVILGANDQRVVGFHGVGCLQRSGANQAAVDDTPLADAAGEAPTDGEFDAVVAQVNAITTLVNELRSALVEKGIIKGEA
jgi:hypothetical protein